MQHANKNIIFSGFAEKSKSKCFGFGQSTYVRLIFSSHFKITYLGKCETQIIFYDECSFTLLKS